MDDFDELAAAEAQLADLQASARFVGREHAIHTEESYAKALASAQAYVDNIKARAQPN